MKSKPLNCDCCQEESRGYSRSITDTGVILCNNCNMKLISYGTLYFTETTGLKITGKNGDFYVVEHFSNDNSNFFETQQRASELAEMDGQSMVDFGINESYM